MVKDYNLMNFIERTFNMFSPISLNFNKNSPGRSLLQEGYDTRLITMYSPDGDDLTDSPNLDLHFKKKWVKKT